MATRKPVLVVAAAPEVDLELITILKEGEEAQVYEKEVLSRLKKVSNLASLSEAARLLEKPKSISPRLRKNRLVFAKEIMRLQGNALDNFKNLNRFPCLCWRDRKWRLELGIIATDIHDRFVRILN